MSTLIDQRILIPAPMNVVWGVLADQSQLPRWRVDCQQVAILTTRQFGVGMRRRCMNSAGKDKVEEITAWYEGLGYEYTLVDSRQFQNWRGRIRLQAVPEGTIVQWTISYDPAGFLRGLLNRLTGAKSGIEAECIESLRQLRRGIEQMGHTINAPAEQRKSRTLQPVQSVLSASQQMKPVTVEEVEVSIADTKPRKPDGLAEAIAALPEPPKSTPPAAPTVFTPPVPTPTAPMPLVPPPKPEPPKTPPVETIPPVKISDTEPKKAAVGLPPGMPESLKITPPKGIDVSRLRYADELEDEDDTPPKAAVTAQRDVTTTQIVRPGLPPPTGQDSGQVSIWEAFGLKPPSQQDAEALSEIVRQTKEMKKVIIDDALTSQDTFTFSPLYPSPVLRVRSVAHRTGLRSQQARSHVKVRERKK